MADDTDPDLAEATPEGMRRVMAPDAPSERSRGIDPTDTETAPGSHEPDGPDTMIQNSSSTRVTETSAAQHGSKEK